MLNHNKRKQSAREQKKLTGFVKFSYAECVTMNIGLRRRQSTLPYFTRFEDDEANFYFTHFYFVYAIASVHVFFSFCSPAGKTI